MSKEDGKPAHWDLWVKAARTYLEEGNWGKACEAVGRTYTTILNWRLDPRWQQAVLEAEELWHGDVRNDAFRSMHKAIKENDGQMTRFYLERRDKAFAPPKQAVDATVAVNISFSKDDEGLL